MATPNTQSTPNSFEQLSGPAIVQSFTSCFISPEASATAWALIIGRKPELESVELMALRLTMDVSKHLTNETIERLPFGGFEFGRRGALEGAAIGPRTPVAGVQLPVVVDVAAPWFSWDMCVIDRNGCSVAVLSTISFVRSVLPSSTTISSQSV